MNFIKWLRANFKKLVAVHTAVIFLSFELMWVSGYAAVAEDINKIKEKKTIESAIGHWDKKGAINGVSIRFDTSNRPVSVTTADGRTHSLRHHDGNVEVTLTNTDGNNESQSDLTRDDSNRYFGRLTTPGGRHAVSPFKHNTGKHSFLAGLRGAVASIDSTTSKPVTTAVNVTRRMVSQARK